MKFVFFQKKKKQLKSDNILIISTRVKCYSKGDPWDSSLWNESYVENIIYTINRVNELFENNSLLRLHPSQNLSSESYYKFLKAKVIKIRFDAEKNIEKSIFHSKLNIVTQNSTVLLQCLLWNLPVMAYWSEILSPLNNDAKKYFGLLEDVGIFHKNPKSLIDSISDIDIWWNSNKVQNARVKFCHKYINSSVNNVFSAMSVIKKRRKYTNE